MSASNGVTPTSWYEALLANVSEVVTVLDPNGQIRYLSGSTSRLLGRAVTDRLGESIFDYVHPDDQGRAAEIFMQALDRSGPVEPLDVRMLHEDGTYHVFEVRANNMIEDPVIGGIILSSRDLTDRLAIERTRQEAETRFEEVFENAAVGANIVDRDGRFLRVNGAYSRMLGFTATELLRRTIYDVSLPEDVERTRDSFTRLIAGEVRQYAIEKQLVRADGGTMWARISASVVRNELGDALYTIGLVIDTSETHALTEQLAHAASHDHLTGLASRSVLHDHVARVRAQSDRSGDQVVLLAVDLDDFKTINDQYGHRAGDDVLVEVGRRLEAIVRTGDLVVRYGGDEFIVVLHPISTTDEAIAIADRIVESLAEPTDVLGTRTCTGASVGITVATGHVSTDDLLAQADAAAYEAKQRGKGRAVLFDELHRVTPVQR